SGLPQTHRVPDARVFPSTHRGLDAKRRYPVLNKNAGAKKDIDDKDPWWKKPISGQGRRPRWELKPTKHSDFKALPERIGAPGRVCGSAYGISNGRSHHRGARA